MGILSNLFKQKSVKSKSERPEGRSLFAVTSFSSRTQDPETPLVEDEAGDAPLSPEETAEAPQKSVSFGNFKRNTAAKSGTSGQETLKNINLISAPPAPAPGFDIKPPARNIVPVKAAAISDKQISIDADDVLPQIPPQLLKTDRQAGLKKALLFNTGELLPGLSQGKATAPVARIAELAPELFNDQPLPADAQVELPLQKIVAQIGVFPGRPDQIEEIYPPLDSRYAKLALEKGASVPAASAAPVAQAQSPVEIEEAIEEPVAAVETTEAADIPAAIPASEPAIQPALKRQSPAPDETPAVAESNGNGSAASHPQAQPETETVSYSLAAIFPNVPESWLDGKLKSVDGSARITVPFDLVETQLASGRVELPFTDFFQALPENLKGHFSGDKKADRAAKVLIPLNEVFLNLPGVEPLPPPPIPVHPEPGDELEADTVSEIAEPEPEIAAEAAAATEPAPIETEKPVEAEEPEPVVAEIPAAVVEEKKPEAEELAEEEIAHEEAPAEAMPAPAEAMPAAAEVEKQPEPIQQPAEEPIIEPTPVKAELAAEVEPAAAVVEPQPAAVPAPEPVPEPPQVQITPPPVTAYAEQPQPGSQFITPSIQVQRMPPPTLLSQAVFTPPSEAPSQEPEETQSPAPVTPVTASEPVPAVTPAPALNRTVTHVIVTDGKLDGRKTLEHLILLPGINAAALTIKGKTKTAGDIAKNFNVQDTGKAASVLFQSLETHTPKGATGAARSLTLLHDHFSSTWFKQGGVLLCVLHPQRSLEAEPHHALLLVMREIARLRQH